MPGEGGTVQNHDEQMELAKGVVRVALTALTFVAEPHNLPSPNDGRGLRENTYKQMIFKKLLEGTLQGMAAGHGESAAAKMTEAVAHMAHLSEVIAESICRAIKDTKVTLTILPTGIQVAGPPVGASNPAPISGTSGLPGTNPLIMIKLE